MTYEGRMRLLALLALFPLLLLLLAGCEGEPENIQARSEAQQRALEQRYREIEAEAENDVAAQVAPIDNEANALLERLEANAAAPDAAAANAQ